MIYDYEDLSHQQFEELIVCLCQSLLGVSVQGFSEGPDGGRDAKFIGTAELHPSKADPWVGITIIQVKHTSGYNRSFSESDFHNDGSANTVIGKEIPRIKKLKSLNQLDNYMLFSNRRLSGNAESIIRAAIARDCQMDEKQIYLCGVEQLELWLRTFPEAAKKARIDPIDSPLLFDPNLLSEVIQSLAAQKGEMQKVLDESPVPRTDYNLKNKLNNMSEEYAEDIRKRYLKETSQIQSFLSAPENYEQMEMYQQVVEDLQLKIIAHRKDHQNFDKVMVRLVELLLERDPVLRQNSHKGLVRPILFYMYWNCDIGESGNAAAH